jgi:uncharacterized protein YkwD
LTASLFITDEGNKGCTFGHVDKWTGLCYTLPVMNKEMRWPALLLLGFFVWQLLPNRGAAATVASADTNPGGRLAASSPTVDHTAVAEMAASLNQLRRRHNLPPYQSNATLTRLAQAQAERMAALQRVTHQGAGNSSAAARASGAGYPERATEIIYGGPGDQQRAIDWWLNSSLHKSLILSDRYFEFGVGRAVGANNFTYWAIVMGADRPAAVASGLPVANDQQATPAVLDAIQSDLQRPPQTRHQAPPPSNRPASAKIGQPLSPQHESYLASQNSTLPFDANDEAPMPGKAATTTTPAEATAVTGVEGVIVATLLIVATALYVKRSYLELFWRSSP